MLLLFRSSFGLEVNVKRLSNVVPLRTNKDQPVFTSHVGCELPALEEQVKNIPAFLDTAIDLILSDFDYEANRTTNTAIAVRILKLLAYGIKSALANSQTE